jgi:hypothetical protein
MADGNVRGPGMKVVKLPKDNVALMLPVHRHPSIANSMKHIMYGECHASICSIYIYKPWVPVDPRWGGISIYCIDVETARMHHCVYR